MIKDMLEGFVSFSEQCKSGERLQSCNIGSELLKCIANECKCPSLCLLDVNEKLFAKRFSNKIDIKK